jgi:hypothetical protein
VIHISNLVTELKSLNAFDVEIVKKTSIGPLQRVSLPKFPAVEIEARSSSGAANNAGAARGRHQAAVMISGRDMMIIIVRRRM